MIRYVQGFFEVWASTLVLQFFSSSMIFAFASILESYSRHCKVVDERVDDDAVDSAKRAQLELHRPNCVPRGSTVRLIRVLCLCQVLGVELTCPLVHCSDCLLTFPVDCVSRFWAADYFFLGKVFHHYRHFFYHLTGTSSNHTVSARSSWPHWLHILPRIINSFPVLWWQYFFWNTYVKLQILLNSFTNSVATFLFSVQFTLIRKERIC